MDKDYEKQDNTWIKTKKQDKTWIKTINNRITHG